MLYIFIHILHQWTTKIYETPFKISFVIYKYCKFTSTSIFYSTRVFTKMKFKVTKPGAYCITQLSIGNVG